MTATLLSAIQNYCAYQERCHNEVRYKLVALGARGEELEDIIASLIQDKYLDEERYACTYVRSKLKYNNWGRVKIKQGLQQKQVSDYCIRKGLKEIDEEQYLTLIQQLAIKKWFELNKETNPYNKKAKTSRYLLQKGFEHNLVHDIVGSMED